MKLVALSMLRNEEYWTWYSLMSVAPWVDAILAFDNHSEDGTVDLLREMRRRLLGDKLRIFEDFGDGSEHENRSRCLEAARAIDATHVLFLDGDEVHSDGYLGFARRFFEWSEHSPPLPFPPRAGVPGDHTPTDGALVRNLGFRPLHPGFAGPATCIPQDLAGGDHDHGCYNFAIRIVQLSGLASNGLEWGQHGYVEADGRYIQSSAHTLWMPRLRYWHFTHHPRSSKRDPGLHPWVRPVQDFGSHAVPRDSLLELPAVFFRPDGPGNPTLEAWGITAPAAGAMDRSRPRMAQVATD